MGQHSPRNTGLLRKVGALAAASVVAATMSGKMPNADAATNQQPDGPGQHERIDRQEINPSFEGAKVTLSPNQSAPAPQAKAAAKAEPLSAGEKATKATELGLAAADIATAPFVPPVVASVQSALGTVWSVGKNLFTGHPLAAAKRLITGVPGAVGGLGGGLGAQAGELAMEKLGKAGGMKASELPQSSAGIILDNARDLAKGAQQVEPIESPPAAKKEPAPATPAPATKQASVSHAKSLGDTAFARRGGASP